jgi:hypothetical protein
MLPGPEKRRKIGNEYAMNDGRKHLTAMEVDKLMSATKGSRHLACVFFFVPGVGPLIAFLIPMGYNVAHRR